MVKSSGKVQSAEGSDVQGRCIAGCSRDVQGEVNASLARCSCAGQDTHNDKSSQPTGVAAFIIRVQGLLGERATPAPVAWLG